MNKIKVTVDKITMPLITEDELNLIDNNLHSIIEDFLKCKVHDKDLYLSQYIIKKLEEENQELKKQQEEFIKRLENEINACETFNGSLFSHKKEMKVYKEILSKYKEIIGDKND